MSATFTMPRTQLASILARINGTAPANGPKPILQDVRIEINSHVTFTATDIDIQHVETTSTPERQGEATVMVNAKQLRKAITPLKSKDVTVEIDENEVRVGGAIIPVVNDVAEFPSTEMANPHCNDSTWRTMPAERMAEMIQRVIFACDEDCTRYAFGAILIEMDEAADDTDLDYCRFVASDGRRLATDYRGTQRGNLTTALWPASAAKAALKALKKAERATLGISADHVTLLVYGKDGTTTGYVMRQLEGKFPKWRDVFPENNAEVCSFHAEGLIETLTGAIAATSDDSRGADICAHGDALSVSTHSESNGKFFELIDVATASNPLDVNLDASYVLDWIKVHKGYIATIHALDVNLETPKHKQDDAPVVFSVANSSCAIMPFS